MIAVRKKEGLLLYTLPDKSSSVTRCFITASDIIENKSTNHAVHQSCGVLDIKDGALQTFLNRGNPIVLEKKIKLLETEQYVLLKVRARVRFPISFICVHV